MLTTQAVKTGKQHRKLYGNVAFLVISKKLLLGSAYQFAKSQAKGRGQRIGDLNSYIHLTQLDKADTCAVHIGSFRKVFLREPNFLPRQLDTARFSPGRAGGPM